MRGRGQKLDTGPYTTWKFNMPSHPIKNPSDLMDVGSRKFALASVYIIRKHEESLDAAPCVH
jgi:hypothetical protein